MLNIRKGGHRELERYYPLMEIDFDSEELVGKLAIHRGMMNGSVELLIVTDDETGMDAAYALMLTKSLYGYVDMKYMGVMPWFRGKGLGIQTMRLINKYYADTQGILAEITEFDDPDPDRLRKLKKFFHRFGYEEIPCDCTIRGVRDNVYLKPIKGTADIAPIIHRVLPDFYTRFLPDAAVWRMLEIKRE
ncbi:MAG: hypothetical protein IJV41_08085 [Oscillospiraceae bacterium]|nr:hypothetical protein [Oscillospiraceae bacterium]